MPDQRPDPPVTFVRRDGSRAKSWGERRGSWEPFQKGHSLSLRHGTYSEAVIGRRVEEMRLALAEAAPWTDEPAFAGTRELYLRSLATALQGFEAIAELAEERGYTGVPHRLVETVNAMTNTALRAGTLLALDPFGKAKVGALRSSTEANLADLLEQGVAHVERRRAALAAEAEHDEKAEP